MSRLYGSVQGNRGVATRTGSTHITGHIRGWDLGVRVEGMVVGGLDQFEVYLTGGSNGSRVERKLHTIQLQPDGRVKEL